MEEIVKVIQVPIFMGKVTCKMWIHCKVRGMSQDGAFTLDSLTRIVIGQAEERVY